jgi:hypothetical protein
VERDGGQRFDGPAGSDQANQVISTISLGYVQYGTCMLAGAMATIASRNDPLFLNLLMELHKI